MRQRLYFCVGEDWDGVRVTDSRLALRYSREKGRVGPLHQCGRGVMDKSLGNFQKFAE